MHGNQAPSLLTMPDFMGKKSFWMVNVVQRPLAFHASVLMLLDLLQPYIPFLRIAFLKSLSPHKSQTVLLAHLLDIPPAYDSLYNNVVVHKETPGDGFSFLSIFIETSFVIITLQKPSLCRNCVGHVVDIFV